MFLTTPSDHIRFAKLGALLSITQGWLLARVGTVLCLRVAVALDYSHSVPEGEGGALAANVGVGGSSLIIEGLGAHHQ